MKLQAAGMIDPHRDACTTTGAWSVRPSTQGITCTGTWWICSARYRTASDRRAIRSSAAAAAARRSR
jgi:hypothetical protein